MPRYIKFWVWAVTLLLHVQIDLNATQSDTITATLYINKHFEVRDHDAPTKYVWNGETRVARVTGSLKDNVRVQRLRLWPGWNLCSIAVSVPNARSQIAAGRESSSTLSFKYNTNSAQFVEVVEGEGLPAGTVLWLYAAQNLHLRLRGEYLGPVLWEAASLHGVFYPNASLNRLDVAQLRASNSPVWRYRSINQEWQFQRVHALAECPPNEIMAPGEVIFFRKDPRNSQSSLEPVFSFYHQDHVGSAALVSDTACNALGDTRFYPFGCERSPMSTAEDYRYTQKEKDAETSLTYFGYRFVGTQLGRFQSPDPLQNAAAHINPTLRRGLSPQAHNTYAYAGNNPIKYYDPAGLDFFKREKPDWGVSLKYTGKEKDATHGKRTLSIYGSTGSIRGGGNVFGTDGGSHLKLEGYIEGPKLSFELGSESEFSGQVAAAGVSLTYCSSLVNQCLKLDISKSLGLKGLQPFEVEVGRVSMDEEKRKSTKAHPQQQTFNFALWSNYAKWMRLLEVSRQMNAALDKYDKIVEEWKVQYPSGMGGAAEIEQGRKAVAEQYAPEARALYQELHR